MAFQTNSLFFLRVHALFIFENVKDDIFIVLVVDDRKTDFHVVIVNYLLYVFATMT